MSGWSALARSIASLPVVAVTTRQPASVSMFLMLVKSAAESSTASILRAAMSLSPFSEY